MGQTPRRVAKGRWQMNLVYRKSCVFYLTDGASAGCAANCRCCCLCPMSIRRIEGLDLKEHLQFVASHNTAKRAFWIAVVSVLISLATFGMKVIELIRTPAGG